jgi:competence protein ComEC
LIDRRPLSLVAIAFAAGIVADHAGEIGSEWWLFGSALTLALSWYWRGVASHWCILLTVAAVGGAWHARQVRSYPASDIQVWASQERRLVRLEGQIVSEVIRVTPDPDESALRIVDRERTQFTLHCQRVWNNDGPVDVTGLAAVVVSGPAGNWQTGERIRGVGWLSRPMAPMNPGDFDYRRHLALGRINASLFVEVAESFATVDEPPWSEWATWRERCRAWAGEQLHQHLPDASARLAEAFLLGVRGSLPPHEILSFMESGTIHILVVSGLHVGLVAWLGWQLLSMGQWSLGTRALAVIALIAAYTVVTGANPPAVRAAVLATLLYGEYLFARRSEPINSLSASALVVLILDPADLFRPGPQLSFVCAFAILVWLPSMMIARQGRTQGRLGIARQRVRRWTAPAADLMISSLVLWVATAPLVTHIFHLFSPVSVLASAVLIPLSTLALGVGMVFLATAWAPVVPDVLGFLLDRLLTWTAQVSESTAAVEGLSRYVVGPAWWWSLVWYALILFAWLWPGFQPLSWRHASLLVTWAFVGLAAMYGDRRPDSFEFHQLAVGHGNAAILRTPSGRTMLLDAGSTSGPQTTARIVSRFLWHEGVSRIDAVMVTHADVDHFNGLPRLTRMFPIGEVLAPPQLARSQDPGVAILFDDLQRRGIPVRFLWEGDVMRVDGVRMEVLHPPARFASENDNASSLVVRISSGPWSILTTGDLERNGLDRLLSTPERASSVLIAPHHGARQDRGSDLSAWARPALVLASRGRERRIEDPMELHRRAGATVLSTDRDGWILVSLGDRLEVTSWRHPKRLQVAPLTDSMADHE